MSEIERHTTREEQFRLFREIDRREWQLWTLTLVVVVALGGFVGVVSLWKWQGSKEVLWGEWVETVLLVGLAALTLLFCAYVVFQEAALKRLRHDLLAEDLRFDGLSREMVDLERVVANVVHDRERERVRSEFVSSVSHRLRTPLTNVRNSIGAVLQGEGGTLTEGQTRFLRLAGRDVDRLAHLIDHLLDLSRIGSGRAQFRLEAVELGDLVRGAVEGFAHEAERRGIGVGMELDGEAPPVRADRGRIQQALDSLLANSVQLAPEGGRVGLRVRALPEEGRAQVSERAGFHLTAREDYVEVSIRIAGGGLPEEELRTLFDTFTPADGGTADAAPHGLGLAVARELVRAHEGAVWAESDRGEGVAFRLVLPTRGASLQRLESVRRIGEAIEAARNRNEPFSLVVIRLLDVGGLGSETGEARVGASLDGMAALAGRAIRGSDTLVVHPALAEIHLLLTRTGGEGGRIVSERFWSLLSSHRESHQDMLSECCVGVGSAAFPDDATTAVEIEEMARNAAGQPRTTVPDPAMF